MAHSNLEENNKYNYEIIEKHINGELTKNEQVLFQQSLQDDDELKREVDLYKELNNNLAYQFKYKQEDEDFKVTIKDLGDEYFPKKNGKINIDTESKVETLVGYKEQSESEHQIDENKKSVISKRLLMMSGLAVAASVLFFLFNPFINQPSYAQLAEQHFLPYELQTIMGINNGILDPSIEGNGRTKSKQFLKKGKKHYNEKDYASAKQYLEQYLEINTNDIDVQLAKGSCEFKLDQTDSAIQTFKKLKDNSDAQWYLALAYLKNNEAEKAKAILKNFTENSADNWNTLKAKEILEEL